MTESTARARRRRVPAMTPEERRASIIAATVPLLREHGVSVSTRQIAQAAGVAEGTLFGVFPDKKALIRAAILSTFDPEPTVCALGEIDPALDLRERLQAALDIMRPRMERNVALLGALRESGPLTPPTPEDMEGMRHFMARMEESRIRVLGAVCALIEPDRALLRQSPDRVAQLLFMLMMVNTRGFFGGTGNLELQDIVSVLLDGLLVREPDPGPRRKARHTRHGEGNT